MNEEEQLVVVHGVRLVPYNDMKGEKCTLFAIARFHFFCEIRNGDKGGGHADAHVRRMEVHIRHQLARWSFARPDKLVHFVHVQFAWRDEGSAVYGLGTAMQPRTLCAHTHKE